MRRIFGIACSWSKRDEVRAVLTVIMLAATLLIYAAIFYMSRRPAPLIPSGIPLFLRLHPERLLACGVSLFGMFALRRRLQQERTVLEPLFWIFLASLAHLSSLAIQFRWI